MISWGLLAILPGGREYQSENLTGYHDIQTHYLDSKTCLDIYTDCLVMGEVSILFSGIDIFLSIPWFFGLLEKS